MATRTTSSAGTKRPPSGWNVSQSGAPGLPEDIDGFEGDAPGNASHHAPEEEEIYVCFLWEGSNVQRAGVAIYERGCGDLHVCSVACPDSDLLWLIGVVKQIVGRPTAFLTSSAITEEARREMGLVRLQAEEQQAAQGQEGGLEVQEGVVEGAVPVKVLRQAAFSPGQAMAVLGRLTTAELHRKATAAGHGTGQAKGPAWPSSSSVSSSLSSSESVLRLGGLLDLTDAMAVRATGALVQWLAAGHIITGEEGGLGGLDQHELAGQGQAQPAQRRRVSAPSGLLVLPGTVRSLSLGNVMQVDPLSFAALQVFAPQAKGSAAAAGAALTAASNVGGRGGVQEGFSLAAVLDRACSGPGARLLRTWLRRPSTDVDLLRHRHDAVGFLVTARLQAPEAWRDLRKALRKSKDVPRVIARMAGAKAGPGDWWALEQTLLGAGMVREVLLAMLTGVRVPERMFSPESLAQGGVPLGLDPLDAATPASAQYPLMLRQFVEAASPTSSLVGLLGMLQQVIDWPATRAAEGSQRLVIHPGIDSTLDDYRRVHAELPQLLLAETDKEAGQYPGLSGLALKYVPQIGVVMAVPREENGLGQGGRATAPDTAASGLSHTGMTPRQVGPTRPDSALIPGDWTLLYESAEELVYKSPRCLALDSYFGDIDSAVRNMEASITRQMADTVLNEHSGALDSLGMALATVDVLVSLADASFDAGWTRPVLVSEPVLLVKAARHPLQELALHQASAGEAFVPNDIALAPGRPNTGPVAILTGPNGSGKSVYLKLVGLLPIMAQTGCFVPAERAILGPVDRLFTRIASLESATVPASTFAIDVQQLGAMLRHSTPRSLLLVDELGKGTNSVDGVALLAASIRALLAKGAQEGVQGHPPKTLVATHFREVLDLGLLADQPQPGPEPGPGPQQAGAGDGSGRDQDVSPPPAPKHVSFFKMEVVLTRERQDTARQGRVQEVQVTGDGPGGAPGASSSSSSSSALDTSTTESTEASWEDVVTPLFKLKPGRADSSYGLACARKAGVPVHVLDRAQEVSAALTRGQAVPSIGHSKAWQRSRDVRTPGVIARMGKARAAMDAAAVLMASAQPSSSPLGAAGVMTALMTCMQRYKATAAPGSSYGAF